MILDTTLREGLQAHGIYLSWGDRADLAIRLARCGILEVEIGCAGRNAPLRPLQRSAQKAGLRTWVWSRSLLADIEETAQSGAYGVSICMPASLSHLQKRLNIGVEEACEQLQKNLGLAKRYFEVVQVGLEDASRANADDLFRLAQAAAQAGAYRIRLADTVGWLGPADIEDWIRPLACLETNFGFHGHNDFGMATANAQMVLAHGGQAVDASLLGLGERAGIAATEELAGWLCVRHGAKIDLQELTRTIQWFSDRVGVEIPSRKPVVGTGVFKTESGIHAHATSIDPALYEPFPPEIVLARRQVDVGAKSGAAAVRDRLKELGVPEPVDLESLVADVRETSERLRRPLRDEELLNFGRRRVA